MNYEALSSQLMDGNIPRIIYKKTTGEDVMLSVYPVADYTRGVDETFWFFEKK